jgi:hypothetical protein
MQRTERRARTHPRGCFVAYHSHCASMYFIDGLTLILPLVALRRAQANIHHPYRMLTLKFRGTNLSEGNQVYQVQMTYGI